jgi:hypothetical protein
MTKLRRHHDSDQIIAAPLMSEAFLTSFCMRLRAMTVLLWFRRVPGVAARIWFHFVERVAGNHIDE